MLDFLLGKLFNRSTGSYPFKVSKFRGKVTVDLKKCISCGMCERKCPTKAIKLRTLKGYEKKKAVCDRKICIHCGECEYVCPVKAIALVPEQEVFDG